MTFWSGLKFTYRESLAFLWICPLLALVPVVAEFAQHVAEMQVGMYDGPAGAQASEHHPLRLILGFIKTLAVALPGYWVTRFLAGGRDAAGAAVLAGRPIRLFAVVFVLSAVLSAMQLFVLPATGSVALAVFLVNLLLMPLLLRWIVAAPLGVYISPLLSIRHMAPQLPWAVAFTLIAILPVMALHYALSMGAVFWDIDAGKWVLLIIDAFVVGWLAALIAASNWVIATRKSTIGADTRATGAAVGAVGN